MLIKEFCAENFTDIPKAIKAGANRIEVCDNLAVGGTTVSRGVLKETVAYCQAQNVPVFAMIRPRGGNFVYDDREFDMMVDDLLDSQFYGINGVVTGALTSDNWLDEKLLSVFRKMARDLEVTFHMAFDQIPKDRQFQAIDWLAQKGYNRILTHGGPPNSSIEDNLEHLKDLVDYADGRITILPGGKVTHENCEEIAEYLGIHEVHGTKIVDFK